MYKDSFMVHNGRKIKWYHSQRFCIPLYSILHIRRHYMCWPRDRSGGKLDFFPQTYQQIHWSDCQYRRPGSCNRRTRSQWISPYLMEEGEGGKKQQLPRQHDEHISGKTDNSPSLFLFKVQNLVRVKGKPSLFWLSVTPGILVKNMREIKNHNKRLLIIRVFNKVGTHFQRHKGGTNKGKRYEDDALLRIDEKKPIHVRILQPELQLKTLAFTLICN